ncbi:hypothetical protein C922_03483 [Plasmodium inui San Antonio 1]|uniref:Uncharacterized protein n=1 Tax=Plasmodium inui San Antonio 1 TaxID=1237626 RepID=W7A3Z2_9APIC|nr:hypothetical protein C922_03483 [Plasmodium inui San Antonio 1]EUD66013.1 hypothetical protein C922_03483 [Plasmodium inui San Antonio 1]
MGKGEDKRNAQGGVFAPAEGSQPGKTSIKGSSQTTVWGKSSPLRKLPYLLIPLSVKFPLLAKLLLLFLFSKWLKHAVGNVPMSFLYRKNEEAFQQLIQLLLLQMHQSGGKNGSNKSTFRTVRPMVDGVYRSIEGMMKCITRVYFFLYGTQCSEVFFAEEINEKAELMSTPSRVSNLWVLRGAYLNLFVALLGHPGEGDKAEGQLHQRERRFNQQAQHLPYPDEQTLYKNIRDLYKEKYQREYHIMMRSEEFSFLHPFYEIVLHTGKKVFSCLHLMLLTMMSIYCLCRSLFILTRYIHAMEKKKLYERCCEGRAASDELFRLLIESVAHMSQDLTGEEAPICAEGNYPDGDDDEGDDDEGDDHDDANDAANDGDLPDGELHIYDALQTKLRLCLSIINRIKGEHPRGASKMFVKQNPRQAQELARQEELVPTYEPPRQKEVYETEPASAHTGGETEKSEKSEKNGTSEKNAKNAESPNDDPTSQRKEQQRDGTLTYAIYLYHSRTAEAATQGERKRQEESTSVEDPSMGQSLTAQKEENRTEGKYTNGPMDSHLASCGIANKTDKRHTKEGSSPHPSVDPHGSKAPSNLSCQILINELKKTFKKKKQYVYLSKKLCFDESVGDFVMRDVSSDGKGKSGRDDSGSDGSGRDDSRSDGSGRDDSRSDGSGRDDSRSDKGRTKRRVQVGPPGGAYPRSGEDAQGDTPGDTPKDIRKDTREDPLEEDCLSPMADVPAFRQNIAAAISRGKIV